MSMEDKMPATGNGAAASDPAAGGSACTPTVVRTATRWPSDRILNLLGIDLPIILAPMAGATTTALAIGVAEAGGLGSIAGAMLSQNEMRAEIGAIRAKISKPVNLNFFCHAEASSDPARETAWRQRLKSYYVELGLDPKIPSKAMSMASFAKAQCDLVAELRPEVVSFQFGLPSADLLSRVKATGAKVLATATSVKEALWLEQRGCDAIIAQGWEAG